MNVALGDLADSAKPPLVLVSDPLQVPLQPMPLPELANGNTAPSSHEDFAQAPMPAVSSTSVAQPKHLYPKPAEFPTQEGPRGIRFDFNSGCRLMLPQAAHPWKVQVSELDPRSVL